MLDCSAIAKGYGSDIVARFLKKKGIQNFMVEIGGEIVVNGNSDKQVPWRVGINKPTDDQYESGITRRNQCDRHSNGNKWKLSEFLL